jgi:hypothetical protein
MWDIDSLWSLVGANAKCKLEIEGDGKDQHVGFCRILFGGLCGGE